MINKMRNVVELALIGVLTIIFAMELAVIIFGLLVT